MWPSKRLRDCMVYPVLLKIEIENSWLFWTMLWHRFDTCLKYNNTSHPQRERQIETVKHTLWNLIWSISRDKHEQWDQDYFWQFCLEWHCSYFHLYVSLYSCYKKVSRHVLEYGRTSKIFKEIKKKLDQCNVGYKSITYKHGQENMLGEGDVVCVLLHKERFSVVSYRKLKPKYMILIRLWRRLMTILILCIFQIICQCTRLSMCRTSFSKIQNGNFIQMKVMLI